MNDVLKKIPWASLVEAAAKFLGYFFARRSGALSERNKLLRADAAARDRQDRVKRVEDSDRNSEWFRREADNE